MQSIYQEHERLFLEFIDVKVADTKSLQTRAILFRHRTIISTKRLKAQFVGA